VAEDFGPEFRDVVKGLVRETYKGNAGQVQKGETEAKTIKEKGEEGENVDEGVRINN